MRCLAQRAIAIAVRRVTIVLRSAHCNEIMNESDFGAFRKHHLKFIFLTAVPFCLTLGRKDLCWSYLARTDTRTRRDASERIRAESSERRFFFDVRRLSRKINGS